MRRIGPRRSSPKWQERRWNRSYREKQRTADAGRLMRLGVAAPGSMTRTTADQYFQAGLDSLVGLTARGHLGKLGPYEGLSRMKGNFHVRFLEGGGQVTARLHSA